MRTSALFHVALACGFLVLGGLLATGTVSSAALFDAFQRSAAGVSGSPGESDYVFEATAEISPREGYEYPGNLSATLEFALPDGPATRFDLRYPDDYNALHDGPGPLWLDTIRPDFANNPQVSPIIGNSCLQTIRAEALATPVRYRTGYAEYIVCRVLDEERPDEPRIYDIATAKPAIIGVLWTSPNQQPIDIPRERCVAEARIWSTEIAKPGDRFMACVFVVDEDPAQIEVFGFELTEDRITEVDGKSESWSRRPVETREATRLVQFRMMQDWLADPEAHSAAVDRAHAAIIAGLDKAIPERLSRIDKITDRRGVVFFTFAARSDAGLSALIARGDETLDIHLFKHLRPLVCNHPERAALAAFQENRQAYGYELNKRDGSRMVLSATFPNMPC